MAVGMAAVFFLSLRSHLAEPWRVRDSVVEIGLPRSLAQIPVAIESALIAALLLAPRLGLAATGVYLFALTATMGLAKVLGTAPSDCGCFAAVGTVDASFFRRNAALTLAALGGSIVGANGRPVLALGAAAVAGASAMIVSALKVRQRSMNRLRVGRASGSGDG
jgi:hypothetical protein